MVKLLRVICVLCVFAVMLSVDSCGAYRIGETAQSGEESEQQTPQTAKKSEKTAKPAPVYTFPKPPEPTGELVDTLKVMTYNIQGGKPDGRTLTVRSSMHAAKINLVDPDVVLLCEARNFDRRDQDLKVSLLTSKCDVSYGIIEFSAEKCGQFTWTGFDYLGEPCPYDAEWPSRSAYFGIFDLAGLPKDRYWLFKSQWTNEPVLHLFPHWNWEGKEGQGIPVHCFTSFDRAELFVNGVSQGIRKKHYGFEHELEQYRFIWKSVPYEAGELKVVAYNKDGSVAMEDVRRTAGKPARLILTPEKATLSNNTDDVLFIRVEAVDENGIFCPLTNDDVSFTASGALIRGTDNGDQRDTRGLIEPCRKLYNGMCVVAISTDGTADNAVITAKAEGYPDTAITIKKG